MSEQPWRPADLRAPIPTLEADDALVVLLASRAASGAPATSTTAPPARTPVGRWQAGLATTAVALIMIGAAWLTGLHPEGSPDPAPPPATPPTVPTPTPVAPSPTTPTPSAEQPASEPAGVAARPTATDDTDAADDTDGAGNTPRADPDRR